MQAASDVLADAYCIFGCRPSKNRLRQASRVTQRRPPLLSRTTSGQPRSRRRKRLPPPVRVGRMSATQASNPRRPAAFCQPTRLRCLCAASPTRARGRGGGFQPELKCFCRMAVPAGGVGMHAYGASAVCQCSLATGKRQAWGLCKHYNTCA